MNPDKIAINGCSIAIKTLHNSWLCQFPSERSQAVKASTVETTKIQIDKYLIPGLRAVRLSALNVKTIETYLKVLLNEGRMKENSKKTEGLSPKAVRNIFDTLHRALYYTVRFGLLPINPATQVQLPKYQRPPITPWSGEQAGAFIQYAENRHDPLAPVWRLLLVTGLRRGELVGLRWSDIDPVEAKISVAQPRVTAGNLAVTTKPKSRAGTCTLAINPGTVTTLAKLKNTQEAQQRSYAQRYLCLWFVRLTVGKCNQIGSLCALRALSVAQACPLSICTKHGTQPLPGS